MEQMGALLIGLLAGLAVGAVAVWFVLRARQGAVAATAVADAERAKTEVAQARSETAQARSDLAREAADAARARQEAAEARAERADAVAALSDARADASAALALRDAAVQRAAEIAADREQLTVQFKALSAEILASQTRQADAAADQRQKQTDALLAPVKETLEAFRKQLGEVERDRAAIATDLRNQVTAVKQTGDDLRKETAALVSALRQPQVRGNWGEQQLKRVVELAGMVEHCDFTLQSTTRNDAGSTIRPDLKVLLAGGKLVFVDSKVPLTAFLDAYDATEEAQRAHHLGRFVRHVQTHIEQLSKKDYFTAETATPEFVVLFMPSEALAAEAFSRFPALHEYAAERGVVVASPTSLIAMLKTVAFSWRQAALADSAKEVFDLGRTLYRRLGNLGSEFNKVGRALTSAVTAYNASVGSIESRVFPTARKLKDLNVVDTDLVQVVASEAAVRPLTAPELVEDAEALPVMIGRVRPAELDALPGREPTLDDLASEGSRAPQLPVVETA